MGFAICGAGVFVRFASSQLHFGVRASGQHERAEVSRSRLTAFTFE